MGITIHYTFLRSNAPEPLMQEVAQEAVKQGMTIVRRAENHLCIEPHPHSEWIDLHWKTWKAIKDSPPQGSDDADRDAGVVLTWSTLSWMRASWPTC